MIELKNITKAFDNNTVIENLSCEFEDGKTYCIMGRTGCGKTTLLSLIAEIIKPDSGKISGFEYTKKSIIYQNNRLLKWSDAYGNLKFVTNDENAVNSALEKTGLFEDKHKMPSEMSGGMKRRLAIARAVAYDGDAYFIDEPLYGLDVKTSEDILELIKNVIYGKTSFIVTHSPHEAYYLADEILFIEDTPVKEILRKSIRDFSSEEDIIKYIR